MNKKGFTLIELLAVIVILSILAGIAVISYNSIMDGTRKKVFINYENTMINVTKMYLLDHPDEIGSSEISLGKLIDGNYIKPFENPEDVNNNCSEASKVVITPITNSINYTYKACLICGSGANDYRSEGC